MTHKKALLAMTPVKPLLAMTHEKALLAMTDVKALLAMTNEKALLAMTHVNTFLTAPATVLGKSLFNICNARVYTDRQQRYQCSLPASL